MKRSFVNTRPERVVILKKILLFFLLVLVTVGSLPVSEIDRSDSEVGVDHGSFDESGPAGFQDDDLELKVKGGSYDGIDDTILHPSAMVPNVSGERGGVPDHHDAWSMITIDQIVPGVHDVKIGDIDGDGINDIVAGATGNVGPGGIQWYEYDFQDKHTLTHEIVTGSVNRIMLHDVDRDGDLDVFFTDSIGETLNWAECPADPHTENWIVHEIASGISGTYDLEVTELDGDGRYDILITSLAGNSTRWYGPDEDYTNWEGHDIDLDTIAPYDCSVADLDRDGDKDVIVAGLIGEIVWYENTGTETWNRYTIDNSLGDARALDTGDLDRDGKMDIVCGDSSTGIMYWYRGPMNPAVDTWQRTELNGTIEKIAFSMIADLDEDGYLDVVVSSLDSGLLWFRNREGYQMYEIDHFLNGSFDFDIKDLDRDGDLDVVVAWLGKDSVVLYLSKGHGYQGEDAIFHPYNLQDLTESYRTNIGWITPDQFPDVVFAGDKLMYAEMRSNLQPPLWHIINDNGTVYGNLCTGDMDGDGYIDIIAVGDNKLYIYWNLFEQGPDWDPEVIYGNIGTGAMLEAIDMNDDLVADILVKDGNELYWIEHNTTGPWERHDITANATINRPLIVGNVNQDHLPDIVDMNGTRLVWLENLKDPNGTKWVEHTIIDGFDNGTVLLVDKVGNWGMDLFHTSPDGLFHETLINLNNGESWARLELVIGDGFHVAAQGEIYENGAPQILMIANEFPGMGILDTINGSYSFRQIEVNDQIKESWIRDMDADGDLDIVVFNSANSLLKFSNEILLVSRVDFTEGSFEVANPAGALSLQGYSITYGINKVDLPDVEMPERAFLSFKEGINGSLDFAQRPNADYFMNLSGFPNREYGELAIFFTSEFAPGPTIVDFIIWSEEDRWNSVHGQRYQDALARGIWTDNEFIPMFGPEDKMYRRALMRDTNHIMDFFVNVFDNGSDLYFESIELMIGDRIVERPRAGDPIIIMVTMRNENLSDFTGKLSIYVGNFTPGKLLSTLNITIPSGMNRTFHIPWKPSPKKGEHTLVFIVENALGHIISSMKNEKVFVIMQKEEEEGGILQVPEIPPEAAAPVIGATGVVAAAYIFSSERFRYKFFAALFPLYTRLTKKDIENDLKEQNYRGRIYQFILDHPSANYSEIKRSVGVGNGQLTHHLVILQKHGFIKERNNGRQKIYCTTGMNFPEKDVNPMRLNPTQMKILRILTRESSLSQKAVREKLKLKISQQAVNANIKILQYYGIIKMEKKGVRSFLHLSGKLKFTGSSVQLLDDQGESKEFYTV